LTTVKKRVAVESLFIAFRLLVTGIGLIRLLRCLLWVPYIDHFQNSAVDLVVGQCRTSPAGVYDSYL